MCGAKATIASTMGRHLRIPAVATWGVAVLGNPWRWLMESETLDPFPAECCGNSVIAQEVGTETTTYVRNIHKYHIATR
jgi:hypothetical protein